MSRERPPAFQIGRAAGKIAVMSMGGAFADDRQTIRVSTQEGYDLWAEIYDVEGNPLIALEESVVDQYLGDIRGLDVIDLGCGTGRHSLRLAAAGARVTAVDFSRRMVEKAESKPGWDRVRFVEHDLTRPLPFPDQCFDWVTSFLVLDHIADLSGFFRECRRICRADGCVFLTTMHPAMMLRGIQAHFTDPSTGRDILPASAPNQVCDYVMGAIGAGLQIVDMREYAVDEALAERKPRAAKYLHWPMLLVMSLRP